MGVIDHGAAGDALTSLPDWAASVATVLEAAVGEPDLTISERIDLRLPMTMTPYEPVFDATGINLGNDGNSYGAWCQIGSLTYVTAYARFQGGAELNVGTGFHSFQLPTINGTQIEARAVTIIGSIMFHTPGDFYKGEMYAYDQDDWSGQILFGCQGTRGNITSVGPNDPFTWASGDFIRAAVLFQAR